MLRHGLFVGLLAVVACDGRSLPVDNSSTAGTGAVVAGAAGTGGIAGTGGSVPVTGGSGTTGTAGGTGTSCAAPPASALCSQNPAGAVTVNTMPNLLAAMVGRWLLCGNQSAFAVDGGDIGLEITADGHWYKLYAAQGGTTIRGGGFDQEGAWTALDQGDHFQVNFGIFGSGTVITSPVFAAMPRAMRLNNNGVFVGNYVIDPSVSTGNVRCASQPAASRSGECTPPPQSLIEEMCTNELATARTVGRWSRCGGLMPGAPAHDGIELTADGSFYFLHRDPSGGLVRGSADADHGTATLAVSGPCRADITIRTVAGTSLLSSTARYDSMPRQLWIYTSPEWGDPERYTFVSR